MLTSVFLKTLRERLRAFRWWCLGTLAFVSLYVAFSRASRARDRSTIYSRLPAGAQGLCRLRRQPRHRLGRRLPRQRGLLVLGADRACRRGNCGRRRRDRGEEERGTLDLLLSLPLSRTRCLLEKMAALFCEALALAFVIWILLVIGSSADGMDVSAVNLAAAMLGVSSLRARLRDDRARYRCGHRTQGAGDRALGHRRSRRRRGQRVVVPGELAR